MRFFRSIRTQLMTIVILCWLIPVLVLGVYMSQVLSGSMRQKSETALSTGAENAWTMVEQRISRVISLAREATYDGELTEDFLLHASGDLNDTEFLRRVRSYIDRKYSREELLSFAACIPLDHPAQVIAGSVSLTAMEERDTLRDAVLSLAETLDTRVALVELEGTYYLVRNLLSARMERYGILVLGIDLPALLSPVSAFADSWNASYLCRLDEIRYLRVPEAATPPAAEKAAQRGLHETADGKALTYTCTASDSRDLSACLMFTVSRSRVYGELDEYRSLMLLLILMLIPAVALMALYLHHRIIQPITRLSAAARKLEAGEFGVAVPVRSRDELGRLGITFSRMSCRLRALIDKTYKEELALRDAKLQALQSRINPHFINNALETINWQARLEGSEKLPGMVEALSTLLDASMSRQNRHIVTLEEENRVTEAYLTFIRQRYGERLKVTLEVPQSLQTCRVPLLTIQPLLENAVEHGIAPAGGGELSVRCFREGNSLHIRVSNNGTLSQKDREQIHLALSDETPETGRLGLRNIATRLRILYDGKATISVEPDGEGHTVAEVVLPDEK